MPDDIDRPVFTLASDWEYLATMLEAAASHCLQDGDWRSAAKLEVDAVACKGQASFIQLNEMYPQAAPKRLSRPN